MKVSRFLPCAAALLTLGAATSDATPEEEARVQLRTRLVAQLAVGDTDAARTLVRSDRVRSGESLEILLAEAARYRLQSQPDSAEFCLRAALAIADLHASEFGDSLHLRIVGFHRGLAREHLPAEVAAWERFREARRLREVSAWQQAIEAVPDVLRLARAAGDPYLEEHAERLSAACLFLLGRFEESREAYGRALELTRKLGDEINESRILRNMAASYQREDRLDEALETFESVLEPARRAGDWELYAGTLSSIGMNLQVRGHLDSAQAQFEKGLAVSQARGIEYLESSILVNLGGLLRERGDYEGAAACKERALRISRESGRGNKRQELWALVTLSSVCSEMGEYSRALTLLREALPMAEEMGVVDVAAAVGDEIGNLYRVLGRPDEALRHYEAVLPVWRQMGVMRYETMTLRSIALVHAELGNLDDALRMFEAAAERAQSFENRFVTALTLCDLGWVHVLRHEPARSEPYLRRALAVADTLGNPILIGLVERTWAQAASQLGDHERAMALFDQSISRGRSFHSHWLLQETLIDKARYLREKGDLAAAEALVGEAIEIIESVRRRQRGDEIRVGFLTDKKSVYADMIGIQYEIGMQDEDPAPAHRAAFQVAEKSRARSLLDILSVSRADPGRGVDRALQDKERQLAAQISALQAELSRVASEEWPASQVDSLEALLDDTATKYRAVQEEIGARSPMYGALSGQRSPLTMEEVIGRVLAADQMLLEYVIGDEESYLFLAGRDRFRLVHLPVGADSLRAQVAAFRETLIAGHGSETSVELVHGAGSDGETGRFKPEAGRALHSLLIGPVADELPENTRLLVVPDGPLFYLPFGALHDGRSFLIERHAIGYAPSASVLDPALRQSQRGGESSCLAIGNPASYRSQVLLSDVRDSERWRFGELPHAEEEVRRVARYFERSTVLTGAEATEETLKTSIGRASYVHFATHGLLDEKEPILSGLALAQDEDPAEDGLLQTHEILKLRLSADLVALSACNTGLGRIAGGEGILGLTRAFMYAGARSVLISLWEVSDRSTADLIDAFYHAHVEEGLPLDVALQRAQIAQIRTGGSTREWAPFVLMGNMDIGRRAPGGGTSGALLIGLTFAVAIVGVLVAVITARRLRRGSHVAARH